MMTRAGMFLDEWFPEIFLSVPAFAGIIASVFPETTFTVGNAEIRLGIACLAISIIFYVTGGYHSTKKHKRISALKASEAELRETTQKYRTDTQELLQDNLRDLARDCGLNSGDYACATTVRISVYCHDANNRRFIPIARISGDPEFEKPGRPYYPDDQGILREAWRREFFKYVASVDDDDHWAREQAELFNIPTGVAQSISMKAKSVVAWRIEHHETKIGVVVIESTNKHTSDSALTNKVEASAHFPPLQRALYRVNESLIRNMANLIASS